MTAPTLPLKSWELHPPPPPIRSKGLEYTHGYPPDNRRGKPLDFTNRIDSQPRTDRQRHLHYLHSLLYSLLGRHSNLAGKKEKEVNAVRVGRIIRVLWSCKEWREGEPVQGEQRRGRESAEGQAWKKNNMRPHFHFGSSYS